MLVGVSGAKPINAPRTNARWSIRRGRAMFEPPAQLHPITPDILVLASRATVGYWCPRHSSGSTKEARSRRHGVPV